MKKVISRRFVPMFIIIALVLGIVTGAVIGLNCKAGHSSAESLRSENDGKRTEAFIYCENAYFPMYKNTILTQAAFEQYSHSGWDNYRQRFYESNAMDIQNFTDTYMHAPYTGRIKEYSTACNCFAFESERKVRYPNGICDFMTVYVLHSDEYFEIKRLMNSYELIPQGQAIVQQGHAQGPDDPQYPPHLDIQVHQGTNHGINDDVKLNGDVLAYNAFFIGEDTSFLSYTDRSSISNGTYENYAGQWQEDIYNGNWASSESNVFKYSASPLSTLHVSVPNSLAFEDEATVLEVLLGKQGRHYQERLDKIKNIVEHYDTIHYDDLNEYERKIYDSIEYEWLPYSFTLDENAENKSEEHRETRTIFFYDKLNAIPYEQREYVVGEPLKDLPIISNEDVPEGLQSIRPKHIGWKKYFGKEMIDEEFIMPDQDLKLYAVYDGDVLPRITTTATTTTTTIVTQNEDSDNQPSSHTPSNESNNEKGVDVKKQEYSTANIFNGKSSAEWENNYISVGNTVTLGKQDNEDIEWIVLEKQNNKALLISKYIIEFSAVHTNNTGKNWSTAWNNCELRNYLNSDFITNTFSSDEAARIIRTTISTEKNPIHDVDGGEPSNDQVFVLSLTEVEKYFSSDNERVALATENAMINNGKKKYLGYESSWWLRTRGCGGNAYTMVMPSGKIDYDGRSNTNEFGIRPAMWITC